MIDLIKIRIKEHYNFVVTIVIATGFGNIIIILLPIIFPSKIIMFSFMSFLLFIYPIVPVNNFRFIFKIINSPIENNKVPNIPPIYRYIELAIAINTPANILLLRINCKFILYFNPIFYTAHMLNNTSSIIFPSIYKIS